MNDLNSTILIAKLHEDAKIPTKRDEDLGYDLYPAFDEDLLIIPPLSTKVIPTGLCSAFDSKYGVILKERSKLATLNIGLGAGVIDSGYRGEWGVVLRNYNIHKAFVIRKGIEQLSEVNNDISLENEISLKTYGISLISSMEPLLTNPSVTVVRDNKINEIKPSTYIEYPYTKAIAQFIIVPNILSHCTEVKSIEEIKSIPSERGTGGYGSSGK